MMDIAEAINLLETIKFCDVDELPKIKAVDMAIVALQEKEKREYNPKLTFEDLQQQKHKWIWWENFGGMWCQCKNGYVVTDNGTFSFDFVISHGSAYARKPDVTA